MPGFWSDKARHVWALISVLLWLIGLPTLAASAPAAPAADALTALQRQAQALGLARHPDWLALLHYKRQPLTGRWRSLADDPRFFNAADGATNPEAELAATLAAFADPVLRLAGDQPAACRFPARRHWLAQRLGSAFEALPVPDCPRFDQWRAGLQPHSVSLIFPVAYVNSPASMYGHTFLRINQGPRGRANPTLAYTINYAADGNEAEGLAYAFKGLAGLYTGRFTTQPYYLRTEEYSHLENRDIWEYDLAFTEAEIQQLLAHTWELGFTEFDYFFFDENCSYQLLSLLDVARPGLNLTDQFTWWTLPVDTVRALRRVPGLVTGAHFRPSNSTDMAWRARQLDDEAVTQAREVGLGQRPAAALLPEAVDPLRRAQALELGERLATYRGAIDRPGEAVVQAWRRAVLIERARLPVVDLPPPPAPPPPEAGHGTGRLDLLAGEGRKGAEWRLAIRPAYHDLLDPEVGFQRGAHIQFGAMEFSGGPGRGVQLARLTPVDIVSLTPNDRLISATSWKARFGLSRDLARPGESAPLRVDVNGGPGQTWALGGNDRALIFALMDNQAWWHPHAATGRGERTWTVGSGLHLGAVLDPADGWRLKLHAHWRVMAGGAPREMAASILLRRAVGEHANLIARCDWQRLQGQPTERTCLGGWQRYW